MCKFFEFYRRLWHPIPSPRYLKLGRVLQLHHILIFHLLFATRTTPYRICGIGCSRLVPFVIASICRVLLTVFRFILVCSIWLCYWIILVIDELFSLIIKICQILCAEWLCWTYSSALVDVNRLFVIWGLIEMLLTDWLVLYFCLKVIDTVVLKTAVNAIATMARLFRNLIICEVDFWVLA